MIRRAAEELEATAVPWRSSERNFHGVHPEIFNACVMIHTHINIICKYNIYNYIYIDNIHIYIYYELNNVYIYILAFLLPMVVGCILIFVLYPL